MPVTTAQGLLLSKPEPAFGMVPEPAHPFRCNRPRLRHPAFGKNESMTIHSIVSYVKTSQKNISFHSLNTLIKHYKVRTGEENSLVALLPGAMYYQKPDYQLL